MLLGLFLLFVFAITAGALWFHGLWGNIVTLVNMLIAALVATCYYEPVTIQLLDLTSNEYSYLMDFLAMWLLFAFTFGILRLITDIISPKRVKFHPMTELVGRGIAAVVVAYVMTMFTAFTVHAAPVEPQPFRGGLAPGSQSFFFMSPESQWLGFVRGQSKFGLKGSAVFDPNGTWISSQLQRRNALAQEKGFLSQ